MSDKNKKENYMKEKNILLLVISLFLFCACATQMSGLQRQSLETEYIEGSYKTIFRAIRTVFQNEGYAVKQSDIKSGFILFEKGGIKVSVTLDDLGDQTEVRTGFTGVKITSEYGIMLKRMYAEVRKQVLLREGREQTPPESKK
jgi:uncharacterized lipoprotein YajG